MNYANKILAYLGEPDRFSQVLLIAGAPPVEKVGTQFKIVLNTVLTPEDIRDTLAIFASHARRTGPSDLGKQGVFAFGMPNQGRFKIYYLTQRGSDFVSIQRMPFDVPKLENLLAQPAQLSQVDEALAQSGGGIVLFTGPSPDTLMRFMYATLARVNDSRNMVIYVLEQHLSFLLKHRNSIVIQVEVGIDVPTLSEGIRNGLFLTPDLMYVSNPKTPEEFEALMCAAQAGALVLVSAIAINEQHLLGDLEKRLQDDFPLLCHHILKTISVNADPAGSITLT
ncbi:MAG: ATPase, T2SS/T4P/T4SS family [bacterium]|jgi:twitching motility protein PilT